MEHPKIKERAYSLASYIDMKKKNTYDCSPEMRPEETGDVPPPISLAPSALENSSKVKELLLEKEQDQHLISLLKKHCFDQSKEIEKLKHKFELLQQDYQKLLESTKPEQSPHHSIIEAAIIARSRSGSLTG